MTDAASRPICPICQDDITLEQEQALHAGDPLVNAVACQHCTGHFHGWCIQQVLLIRGKACPLCRRGAGSYDGAPYVIPSMAYNVCMDAVKTVAREAVRKLRPEFLPRLHAIADAYEASPVDLPSPKAEWYALAREFRPRICGSAQATLKKMMLPRVPDAGLGSNEQWRGMMQLLNKNDGAAWLSAKDLERMFDERVRERRLQRIEALCGEHQGACRAAFGKVVAELGRLDAELYADMPDKFKFGADKSYMIKGQYDVYYRNTWSPLLHVKLRGTCGVELGDLEEIHNQRAFRWLSNDDFRELCPVYDAAARAVLGL
jgi:hypothetical protein